MENCPEEEEDDDAQVGALRITTNTFLPCSVLLLHAKPALAVRSQHCWDAKQLQR